MTAQTKDGIITLTGHDRTWAKHDAVVSTAWMAQGVIASGDALNLLASWAATLDQAETARMTDGT